MILKNILTTLFVLQFFFTSAQICTVPNGDFETWIDFSEEIETSEVLPPNTVLMPEGYFSAFRLFFSLVGDIFETLGGTELIEFASTAFGIQQVTDASSGEFALRIGGDSNGAFSDLIGVSDCQNSLPDTFHVDVKHVGIGPDSLYIQGFFGIDSEIPFEESELENLAAYFQLEYVSTTDEAYQTISIPVVNNNNNALHDTLIMLTLVVGDEENLALDGESYFILDNMRFSSRSGILAHDGSALSGINDLDHNMINVSLDLASNPQSVSIQRSLQANEQFESIVELDLDNKTSYEDYNISSHTVYYYRLKTELENGRVSYSDIISIRTGLVSAINALQVLPNPITDDSRIHLTLESELVNAVCRILDSSGRMVSNIPFPSVIHQGQHTFDIPVSGLSSGIYSIQIGNSSFYAIERIVVK